MTHGVHHRSARFISSTLIAASPVPPLGLSCPPSASVADSEEPRGHTGAT